MTDEASKDDLADAGLSEAARRFLSEYRSTSEPSRTEANLPGLREQFAQGARQAAASTVAALDLEVAETQLAGIDTLLITPKTADKSRLGIFYLFGGGYATGEPESDMPIIGGLARRLEMSVAAPRYRLAPEHPHPAALDDVLAAWRAFIGQARMPVFLVGESAGGGLALAVVQAAKAANLPLPTAMALLSPWVDLTHRHGLSNDGIDPTLAARSLQDYARLYAGRERGLDHPAISPLFGDMRDLPPMIVTTGGRDILREQAYALRVKVQDSGGTCELNDWPGLWHVFEIYPELPEAAASLDRVSEFLRRHDPHVP